MAAVVRRAGVSVARCVSRSFSAQAAAPTSAAAADVDPAHKAWVDTVSKYPVRIPAFEWTLEWMLPTPVPLHQFEEPPIVVEVKDRNADPDSLVYMGPNVIGGYAHPTNPSVKVSRADHKKLLEQGVVETPFDKWADRLD